MYENFKYAPEDVAEWTAEMKSNLMQNKGTDDLGDFGARVIARFVEKNPLRYRDFGPYWWAVKEILIRKGLGRGKMTNATVAAAYCGTNDDETMAAAQTFADYYRATYFIGTQTFPLNDDDADEWILYDPDYENPQE